MTLAGVSMRSRRCQSTIRILSLTPSGVSTNVVLDYLIEDIVQGCLTGFECIDAFGQTVRCFFDIVGFVADYPASTAVVDTLGHTASAPCSHCSFLKVVSDVCSRFAYTCAITSANSSFRRTQDRTASLRSADIGDSDRRTLGLQFGDRSDINATGNCPLLKLCAIYNDRLKLSTNEVPYNSCELDGYKINIIEPDHLVTGLMKGVLLCTFLHVYSEHNRQIIQIYMRACLLDFGFQSQSIFFKDKKLVPGLSMSMMYAIFMIIPPCLNLSTYSTTYRRSD